ncbi:hypothetical protein MLD38_024492 [Melastoma candidum]|uniref:Uncharacterized protein n=1 Tax=Melastoma candidum TaxID=119954 RepID=A0ACB9NVV2_9MYRT|nr:hypothetical protein MLD38_024492 [Melastoma candidum]
MGRHSAVFFVQFYLVVARRAHVLEHLHCWRRPRAVGDDEDALGKFLHDRVLLRFELVAQVPQHVHVLLCLEYLSGKALLDPFSAVQATTIDGTYSMCMRRLFIGRRNPRGRETGNKLETSLLKEASHLKSFRARNLFPFWDSHLTGKLVKVKVPQNLSAAKSYAPPQRLRHYAPRIGQSTYAHCNHVRDT